jgi:hypothetical protein
MDQGPGDFLMHKASFVLKVFKEIPPTLRSTGSVFAEPEQATQTAIFFGSLMNCS